MTYWYATDRVAIKLPHHFWVQDVISLVDQSDAPLVWLNTILNRGIVSSEMVYSCRTDLTYTRSSNSSWISDVVDA